VQQPCENICESDSLTLYTEQRSIPKATDGEGEMTVKTLFNGARFVGQAEGDRRKYYVFEAAAGYLVAAPQAPHSYSVTVIQREIPEVISSKFRGTQITVSTLKAKGRRPDLFDRYFDRLNALYVMVALHKARKLKKRVGKAMVFKISSAK